MLTTTVDAETVLKRVTLRNASIPTQLSVLYECLAIRMSVFDRDTGNDLELLFSFPFRLPMEEQVFLEFVESRTRAAWLHEFNESFLIDGVRVNEPHLTTSDFIVGRDADRPLSTDLVMHRG